MPNYDKEKAFDNFVMEYPNYDNLLDRRLNLLKNNDELDPQDIITHTFFTEDEINFIKNSEYEYVFDLYSKIIEEIIEKTIYFYDIGNWTDDEMDDLKSRFYEASALIYDILNKKFRR